jgi:hypothetical protein
MRKQKTLLYVSFAGFLIVALVYLLGYRFSLSQLNTELNRKLDFGPAEIVYNNTAKDTAIVVSQNDHWIICRQIRKSFGFLWKFNRVALEPILIDPQSDLYTATLNRYIAECETANLPKELTGDNPQLNYSMKNFFAQEAIGSAKGKNFEVKIIRLVKAVITDPELIKIYYYDLVIAPITTRLPIQLKNVLVTPTGKTVDYFKNKTGTAYMTPEDMKDFVKMATFNTWDSVAELTAYEYTLQYSNLSDAVQEQRQLTTTDLDEGMTTLDVTVYFNNTHETIRVNLDSELISISDKSDPVLDLDPNIKAIFDTNQQSSSGFMPFVATKPKQEITR